MAVEDLFTERVAIDPEDATLIKDAPVQVFLPNDLSRANPLRVFEPASGVEITDLRSNRLGIVQQVRVEGDPAEVVFKSGPYEIQAQSKFGVLFEFGLTPENVAAAIAAPEAAAAAGAAQAIIAAGHAAEASTRSAAAASAAADAASAAGTAAAAALEAAAARDVLQALADAAGAPLAEDPDDPGTFVILNPAALTEDPAEPGTFLNGGS